MNIYKDMNIIHYPSLRTMLAVEKVLRGVDTMVGREELKRRLPVKIMHQTLNLILAYLEEKGMIVDSHKGILWIYNPSPKLRKAIARANEKTNSEVERIRGKIIKILKKNNVKKAGIFGSYARGEQKENSDIDIVIEFKGKKSLLDLAGLQFAIEQALNKKADVITYNSINPLLKKRILKEEIRIL